MSSVNIHTAKTQLSRLIEEVAAGGEVVIAKDGKPMARLVPMEARKPLPWGVLRGKITVAEDFDAPLPPEVLVEFEREP